MPAARRADWTVLLAAIALAIVGGSTGSGAGEPVEGGGQTPPLHPTGTSSPMPTSATEPPGTAEPTGDPQPTDTPEPTSNPETHEDAEEDPHGMHDPPTQEEIDQAPTPVFDHDFRTDVPAEQAREILDVTWTWLVPTLEERGWSHLELVEHGVLGTKGDDDGNLVVAKAEIGYSGVYALGHVGIGKIVTVWTKLHDDGTWQVSGFRDEQFGPQQALSQP